MIDNLYLKAFGLSTVRSEWKTHTKLNHTDRLYFVLSGESNCIFNNTFYRLVPNHMYLIPSTSSISFDYNENNPMKHLYFDFQSASFRLYNQIIDIDISLKENLIYKKYLEFLKLFFIENNITAARFLSNRETMDLYKKYYDIALCQLKSIIYLINQSHNLSYTQNQIVANAVNYIHQNYDKKISIKDLASNAYIAESYFIKIFKIHMHQSPYQYLKSCRFENALKMLEYNVPIHVIAEQTGYESAEAFSKSFRKEYGKSPSAFYHKNVE